MRFRVLGPLEADEDGRPVAIGGGRQRALLALLLVEAGQTVSRDRLIDELWAGRPPPSASQSLDAYLSRLRRAFREAGAGDVIVTRAPAGYALPDPDTDAAEFARLVAQAGAARSAGDPAESAARLREAFALWRGGAYEDVAGAPWARAEIERLEGLRLTAYEERFDAELALGRHDVLLAELEQLAARHPTRERLVGQLVLGRYRAGRQADALAAYRAARRALVDELGLEPGPALRALQAAVLRQDPSLDLPQRAAAPGGELHPAPPGRGRRGALALAVAAAAVVIAAVAIVAAGVIGGASAGRSAIAADGAGALDPLTGRVAVSVRVGAAPAAITSDGARVWVSNGADGTVTRIDAAAGHVDQTVAVGSAPAGIAAGAGAVWVANALDGTVSRIEPSLGQVVQTVRVGRRPVAVAVGAGAVWAADADGDALVPIDPSSGRPGSPVRLGSAPGGVVAGFGSLWVTEPLVRAVVRLDPRDGSTLAEIPVGGGAGPIAVGAGSVWVVNTLDGTLSRVDPLTNAVASTVPVGDTPTGVAAGPGGVWVSSGGDGRLVAVAPRTGAVRRSYAIGAAPAGVTLVGRAPWVAAGAPTGRAHRGGTLRVSYTPFRRLDPAAALNVHPAIWRATGDALLAVTNAGGAAQVLPDLATAVPQPTDGGRTYRFRLRRGVRYWTGVPVRPSDVRRQLERLFVLRTDAAGALAALRGAGACERRPARCDLSGAVVADDAAGTLTLRLSRADPELLFKLAQAPSRPVPPGTPRARLAAVVPSTGPYRVGRLAPDRRLLLVRNGRFREWSRASQPDGYPDRIDIAMSLDADARVAAVLHRRADIALEVAPATLSELRTRYASLLRRHAQPHMSFLSLNVRRPPFDDVRARRAINLALDRAAVARRFGGPSLSTPTCQVLPPRFPGRRDYCPWTRGLRDGRWHGRDLARARALVRASGTAGATVRFLTHRDDSVGPEVAGVLAAALRSIGYRPRVEVMARLEGFRRRVGSVAAGWNVSAGDFIANSPSPGELFGTFLGCASYRPGEPTLTTNAGDFCDRRLDRLVAQAERLQTRDPGAADALWAAADRRAVDRAGWVPLVSNASIEVLSARTGHFTLDAGSLPQLDQLWVR
jgi:YVTN family beta-propeller protein